MQPNDVRKANRIIVLGNFLRSNKSLKLDTLKREHLRLTKPIDTNFRLLGARKIPNCCWVKVFPLETQIRHERVWRRVALIYFAKLVTSYLNENLESFQLTQPNLWTIYINEGRRVKWRRSRSPTLPAN